MDIIKLKARPRNGVGKSFTRKARLQGWVPGSYYGANREPQNIEVDHKEFSSLVRSRKLTHLIDLGLSEKQGDSIAVIRDIQRHVLKDNNFLHIDFQHVAMDKKVTVSCPIEIIGSPIGVKEGGVLGHPVKAVTIECMPMEIPEKITIDVSELNIGDSIHVRDVSVPGITIKNNPGEVIAGVTHATREIVEEVKPAEGAEGAEGAAAEGAAPAGAEGGAAPAAEGKSEKEKK